MHLKDINLHLMATNIDIKLYDTDEEKLNNIESNLIKLLEDYNERFNMYNPNSKLSIINDNSGIKPIKTDDDLFDLIKLGKKHSIAANSNLNIAIAPLVKLWNIGINDIKIPSQEEITRTLKITNPNDIEINESNKSIFLKKKGMQIDLGALAKGYIADRLLDYLIHKNIKSSYVNLGGNVLTYGLNYKSPDFNWRIGLQNPSKPRGQHLLLLAINDRSIVTSGIYERKSLINGKEYHHILDPNTGYPIESDMKSITVISDKSVDCEIWTSRLFGRKIQDVLNIAQDSNLDIIIIDKQNNLHYNEGIEKYILWKE